ncbi:mandelate racemase/muconate lactonizing enzyme family protein [Rugosimonospora acidiphila]|uniref:Mandelate racemase/muconate lactonizing enzyme family protein n=1 Tax=Rugosimonospora acidiphila TaxID=556531 RepID=A0ABP9SRG0_9ACTN
MRITDVGATAVAVPLLHPARMSTRLLDRREYLLVEIRTDDGDSGTGYAYAGTRGGRILRHMVEDLLVPVLKGRDPGGIADLWRDLYQESLLMGRRGGMLRAISAVDIALWDLAGKRQGLPLARLLGGAATSVPAYASGGYYRQHPDGWSAAVAEEITHNRRTGFRDHKIKVGGLTVAEDADRVAAAFSVMAPGERLALDANNAYGTAYEAAAAIRAFEAAAGGRGLWWVEEPLSADDLAGHARLRDILDSPIATGELHQTRWEFRDLVERRSADILQVDAGVVGGISEWMLVAGLAAAHGLRLAPHWHANLHAHLVAAVPDASCVEYFPLERDIYNFERMLTGHSRLVVRDGAIAIPDRPGIGVELDAGAVAEFSID